MDTKTKPYRVARTTSGNEAGVMALVPTRFDTRAEAEAYILRTRVAMYDPALIIIEPGDVKSTVAKIKARHLMDFIKNRRVEVATDFDDARDRLLKLADVADKEFARSRVNGPRKGYLKTEAGLAGMFEMMYCLAERRRVTSGSLTPEEFARRGELEARSPRWSMRESLAKELDADMLARAIELTTASLHADEY